MTNLITSAAQLKSVFLALMISDASNAADALHLQVPTPLRQQDIRAAHVNPPEVLPYLGLGGSFETSDWSFSYPRSGKLAYIVRRHPDFWLKNDYEAYRKYQTQADLLNTNAAYQEALSWLTALSVDVQHLTNACTVRLRHKVLRDLVIPEYSVVWSKEGNVVASVLFLAPTRDLWQIRVEDPTYLLRTPITNGLVLSLGKGSSRPH
jgi:hypothetical protein